MTGTRLYSAEHYQSEGLKAVNYRVIESKEFPLYTWYKIDFSKYELSGNKGMYLIFE